MNAPNDVFEQIVAVMFDHLEPQAASYGASPIRSKGRRSKVEIEAIKTAIKTVLATEETPMTVRQVFYRLVTPACHFCMVPRRAFLRRTSRPFSTTSATTIRPAFISRRKSRRTCARWRQAPSARQYCRNAGAHCFVIRQIANNRLVTDSHSGYISDCIQGTWCAVEWNAKITCTRCRIVGEDSDRKQAKD